ncbi:MAG: ATP-binding cassette domain-containing protein, partial [Rothia dentocariosa]|nr:ATP-binding cassette domain-containing protein [Rothia dentocariosa]
MNTTTVGQHRTAEPTGSAGARIELDGFGWHHPGREKPAFSGINLSIEPGQKVLLLGPSGAGKSTLLHALAGVIHDDDGHSQLGTARIDGHTPADARGIVGLMQQDPESSVVLARVGDDVAFGPENLCIPREEIWERVSQALSAVNLEHLSLDHPTSALSGGQKQRLGLAGILAMHPRAILLDEPTANLDPQGVQQVREAVVRAAAHTGATLIVVEHRVSVWAQHMDRVIVLGSGGGITHDGPPEQVLDEARETLIADGVWVPGYVPETPGTPTAPKAELLSAENLAITREYPTKKQLRARRKQLKTMPDAAPVRISMPTLRGGVNLSIRQGEHLSILGPNGAGKSTLALTLAGLLYA